MGPAVRAQFYTLSNMDFDTSKNKIVGLSGKEIMLVGVRHAVQWNGGINGRATKLKEFGYSDDFVEKDRESMKKMRDDMREACNIYNPDLVAEEGGPYRKMPGDVWKEKINFRKILLEDQYKDRHIFVDAKLLMDKGVLQVPSEDQRELAMVSMVVDALQANNNIKRVCFVVGGSHINTIEQLFKDRGIKVIVNDLLKKDYIKEIEELVIEERERISKNKKDI